MKKLLRYFSILSFAAVLWGSQPVLAQCPMCKAAVVSEHNSKESKLAKGLNTGILYMFVLPYAVGTTIIVLWYRAYRRRKREMAEQQNADEIASANA